MRQLQALLGLLLVCFGLAVGSLASLAWKPHQSLIEESDSTLPKSQWEATLYLPTHDNQGKPFPDDIWQSAITRLVFKFGGATLAEPKEGLWIDAKKKLVREQVRPVTITFAATQMEDYRQAVREVGKILHQESMYSRFEQCRVDLLEVR